MYDHTPLRKSQIEYRKPFTDNIEGKAIFQIVALNDRTCHYYFDYFWELGVPNKT
jgi:hypothetical protein